MEHSTLMNRKLTQAHLQSNWRIRMPSTLIPSLSYKPAEFTRLHLFKVTGNGSSVNLLKLWSNSWTQTEYSRELTVVTYQTSTRTRKLETRTSRPQCSRSQGRNESKKWSHKQHQHHYHSTPFFILLYLQLSYCSDPTWSSKDGYNDNDSKEQMIS